jgi:catechol 2,3-dioxygenase-like lactoylglutathione lyase family enzyme
VAVSLRLAASDLAAAVVLVGALPGLKPGHRAYHHAVSIHHLQIWVPELSRAEASWGWLLGELDYTLTRQWERGRVWQCGATSIVIEASPDMVPGMLHSRLRPGMNHVAFHVSGPDAIESLLADASDHGWHQLGEDPRHPLPRGVSAAYLEDRDGFEVELIAPETSA